MIFVVFLTEVELDRLAFEDSFGFAGGVVYDGGDAAVGYIKVSISVMGDGE